MLDEPTAGLDPENERLVLSALDRLAHGRTVLVATHSASGIGWAERTDRDRRRQAGGGRCVTCWPFLKLFRRHAFRMAFGALLMLMTVLAGIGLLGVSGWFITGSALAGLGLLGAAGFNIFTPSAAIRAAALIRTAGRYAERLVNHEATFRLLADLRRWLFAKADPARCGAGGAADRRRSADPADRRYRRARQPVPAGAGAERGRRDNRRRRPGAARLDRPGWWRW